MSSLNISLYQKDDGDGLARFRVLASNDTFSGTTLIWGYAASFSELAAVLDGFPQTAKSKVTFKLGAPRSGLANFEFFCIDGLGHAVVWATLESEYPVFPGCEHEELKLCMRLEAASVDAFCEELKLFARGEVKEVMLYGS